LSLCLSLCVSLFLSVSLSLFFLCLCADLFCVGFGRKISNQEKEEVKAQTRKVVSKVGDDDDVRSTRFDFLSSDLHQRRVLVRQNQEHDRNSFVDQSKRSVLQRSSRITLCLFLCCSDCVFSVLCGFCLWVLFCVFCLCVLFVFCLC